MEVEYKTSKGTIQVEVTQSDFLAYRGVQESGLVNMWDWEAIESITHLRKDTIGAIMENYRALAQEFDPERYELLMRNIAATGGSKVRALTTKTEIMCDYIPAREWNHRFAPPKGCSRRATFYFYHHPNGTAHPGLDRMNVCTLHKNMIEQNRDDYALIIKHGNDLSIPTYHPIGKETA